MFPPDRVLRGDKQYSVLGSVAGRRPGEGAQCGRETKKCQGEGGGGEKGSESPTVEHLLLGTN